MKTALEDTIKILAEKAKTAEAHEAAQLAQAALSLAYVLQVTKESK